MSEEDYEELMRLLGKSPSGQPQGWPSMTETSATFDELTEVWIQRPAAEAGYRRTGRAPLWVRRLPDGTRTLFQVYRRAASPLEGEI